MTLPRKRGLCNKCRKPKPQHYTRRRKRTDGTEYFQIVQPCIECCKARERGRYEVLREDDEVMDERRRRNREAQRKRRGGGSAGLTAADLYQAPE